MHVVQRGIKHESIFLVPAVWLGVSHTHLSEPALSPDMLWVPCREGEDRWKQWQWKRRGILWGKRSGLGARLGHRETRFKVKFWSGSNEFQHKRCPWGCSTLASNQEPLDNARSLLWDSQTSYPHEFLLLGPHFPVEIWNSKLIYSVAEGRFWWCHKWKLSCNLTSSGWRCQKSAQHTWQLLFVPCAKAIQFSIQKLGVTGQWACHHPKRKA